jgi:hypothetical protein
MSAHMKRIHLNISYQTLLLLCPFTLQANEISNAVVVLPDIVVSEEADFSDGRPEPTSKNKYFSPCNKSDAPRH